MLLKNANQFVNSEDQDNTDHLGTADLGLHYFLSIYIRKFSHYSSNI